MSQTEAHVLKITLDASDVDKGLMRARTGVEDLQKSATKSAGGLTLIQGGLQGINKAEREASKALRGFTGVLGPMNGAVGNAIGGIGDLAGLLSGGGALGIAIAAAGAGVLALTKHWESLNRAQDDALNKDWSRLTAGVNALKAQSDRIAKLNEQLRGPETKDTINEQHDETQKRLLAEKDALDKEISAKRTVEQNSETRRLLRLKNQEIERNEEERQKRLLILFKEQNKELAKRGGGRASSATGPSYNLDAGAMLESAEANRQAMRDAPQIKAREELAQELDKADQARHERSLARAIELIDKQEAARKEINDTWAGFGEQMTSTLVGGVAGGFTTLFTEMAAGNKHAAEIALSSFLSSTGQQIVASGVQSVVQGTLYAVDPATAAAAPGMIGAGLAAIGVGTAMAAGGAGINASIPRPGGAATGGRGSSSERGTGSGSSRSGGGGGDGGGGATVININYAAGGPNPEDTARDISSVLDTARRRRFNRSNRRSL